MTDPNIKSLNWFGPIAWEYLSMKRSSKTAIALAAALIAGSAYAQSVGNSFPYSGPPPPTPSNTFQWNFNGSPPPPQFLWRGVGVNWDPARAYQSNNGSGRVMDAAEKVLRGSDGRYYCRRPNGTTGLVVREVGESKKAGLVDRPRCW